MSVRCEYSSIHNKANFTFLAFGEKGGGAKLRHSPFYQCTRTVTPTHTQGPNPHDFYIIIFIIYYRHLFWLDGEFLNCYSLLVPLLCCQKQQGSDCSQSMHTTPAYLQVSDDPGSTHPRVIPFCPWEPRTQSFAPRAGMCLSPWRQ